MEAKHTPSLHVILVCVFSSPPGGGAAERKAPAHSFPALSFALPQYYGGRKCGEHSGMEFPACMLPDLAPFPPPPGANCTTHPSLAPCRRESVLDNTTTCHMGGNSTPWFFRAEDGTALGVQLPPGPVWQYGETQGGLRIPSPAAFSPALTRAGTPEEVMLIFALCVLRS